MTTLRTAVGRLTAAEGRTLRGRLLPFGRPGYTNLGRVTVEAGDVPVPADTSRLFAHLDHQDGRDDVAQWAGITQESDGLWASWNVLENHGGDRLLAEYRAGKRTGISVELEPVTVENGRARGELVGCAFPERPAFDDARLVAEASPEALEAAARALTAAVGIDWDTLDEAQRAEALAAVTDAADVIAPAEPTTSPEAPTLTASTPASPEAAPVPATPAVPAPSPTGESMTVPASAPAALLAGMGAAPAEQATPPAEPSRLTAASARPEDVYRLMAQVADPTTPSPERARLMAALADITPTSLVGRDQPAWVGQLWQGNAYQRRVVPLLTQKELTGLKVRGWRWVTRPAMAKYAGGKTAIPSTAVLTQEYNENAQRFAGGNDIDRSYADFRDTEFFSALHQEYSDSYARLTDAYAVEKMKAAALALTIGANPNSLPVGWVAIVDGMLSMLDIGTPSFAIVEASVWRDMILTPQEKFLEFVNAAIPSIDAASMLQGFRIVPVAQANTGTASTTLGLDKGEVLVGTSAAVTFRELGGGTPIRVNAIDVANGGVDEAAFGYAHLDVTDNRGLRIVDTVTDV